MKVRLNAFNAEEVVIVRQSKLEPAMADSYHAELAPTTIKQVKMMKLLAFRVLMVHMQMVKKD